MARNTKISKKRLGDILNDEGLITEDQKRRALQHQKQAKLLLTDALLDLRYVSEEDIAKVLIKALNAPYLDVKNYKIDPAALKIFPEQMCREYQFFPIDIIGNVVIVVAGSLMNQDIRNELTHVSKKPVQVFVAKINDIYELINKYYKDSKDGGDQLTSLGSLLLDMDSLGDTG